MEMDNATQEEVGVMTLTGLCHHLPTSQVISNVLSYNSSSFNNSDYYSYLKLFNKNDIEIILNLYKSLSLN